MERNTPGVAMNEYGPDYSPEYAQGAAGNPAREARDELIRLLDGLDLPVMVHSDIPQHFTPPAVVILPASQWVTPSTFAAYTIDLDILLVALSEGTAESGLRRLEDMIFAVLSRVDTVLPIPAPQSGTLGDDGARIITTTITIRFNSTT